MWASAAISVTAVLAWSMTGPATAATAAPSTTAAPTATTSPTPTTDSIVTPNIVGGTEATIVDAPWQVALITPTASSEFQGQFCGGSIVAAQWIVTAAHCVVSGSSVSAASTIKVLAGQATLSTTSNTRPVAVSNIYVHPNYVSSADHDDVALLKLSAPLTLVSGSVQAIGLPTAAPVTGATELITGWGDRASGAGNYPVTMRKAQIAVFADSVCAGAYGGSYSSTKMVCAANNAYTIDTCQGDSGGPMAKNTGSAWVLDGITSFGQGCAQLGYPGVYTEVYTYRTWITDTMAQTPAPSAFSTVPLATVSGTKKVGKTLTANEGAWSPTPTSYTYRWLSSATRNGTYSAISGATLKTYVLKSSDRTRFIKVQVTAIKPGYTQTTSTSAATVAIG